MLCNSILKNRDKIRFHTPGHGKLPSELLECDVTELSYSDNLASPSGEIAGLEKKLASAYKAEAAFLSTQGATLNVMQAVYARLGGGAFWVIGKTHLSVYNALRLFSAKAYHSDEFREEDLPDGVGTVIATSPDYFGRTLPLEKIYAFLKSRGIALIVDSAHGAHFAFSSKLPVSASEYADLAILSMHKTMPVLTGGSVLCCRGVYAERCRFARGLLHSTSPGYMTMCTMENAIREFSERGEEYYENIRRAVGDFAESLASPFSVVKTDDFSRLTVTSPYDGRAVERALFARGFAAETACGDAVVFIVTPYNAVHLGLLGRVFGELPVLPEYEKTDLPFSAHPRPTALHTGGEWESLPLNQATGRRLYGEAGLYPPGVPLLYGGDILTEEKARFLTGFPERTFGLENGYARVLK